MMASAPEFDWKAFEGWLAMQPVDVSLVIAARCALRVAPRLRVFSQTPDNHRAIILPLFRGMATPWVAATCLTQGVDRLVAANAAADAYAAATKAVATNAAANAAAAAAAAAAYAAATNAAANAAAAAAYANAAADAAVAAIQSDKQDIESGVSARVLGLKPLWGDMTNPFALEWSAMAKQLSANEADEHWSVWIDWYEARLKGGPIKEDLEIARLVEVSDKEWEQGPTVANARIKEIVERFRTPDEDTLSQRPAAYRFGTRAGALVAEPQVGDLPDASLLDQFLAELTEKAREYREEVDSHGQAPARLKRTACKIDMALTDWSEHPNPGLLLMHLNALEGDVSAYDTPAGRDELPADGIAAMQDLARSLQDFVSLYPSIQGLQAAALALQLQRADVDAVHADLRRIEATAAGSDHVEESARLALAAGGDEVEDETALINSPADEQRVAEAVERRALLTSQRILTTRNFLAQLLRSAQDGAIRGVGSGVEGVTSGSIRLAWGALCTAIVGPVMGIAAVVTSWRPLADRTKTLTDADRTDVDQAEEDASGPE
jgi:hypothetical protein